MAKAASIIQADLRKKGTEIGHTDTLIAGIAITSELQLVTIILITSGGSKDLKLQIGPSNFFNEIRTRG